MPPPLFDTYDGEPTSVALRPLPLESVQVVPEVGAVCKLNCKPEVTIAEADADVKTDVENLRGIDYLLSGICFRNITQIVGAIIENCHHIDRTHCCAECGSATGEFHCGRTVGAKCGSV